jgi:hypothetical protein
VPALRPSHRPAALGEAGDLYHCHACLGEYRLETAKLTFVAAATGHPARDSPAPDLAQIEEVLETLGH